MSTDGPGAETGSDKDVWAHQVSGLAKHMDETMIDPNWDESEQSEDPGCVPYPVTLPPARTLGSNELL